MNDSTKLKLVQFSYSIENYILCICQKILWPLPKPKTVKTICIYRAGNIGDIVCSIPAMLAIRESYPNAKLMLLTSPGKKEMLGAQELLKNTSWIDELLVYYQDDIDTFINKLRLVRRLRKKSIDLFIELPSNLASLHGCIRNMLFARLIGVRWGHGWQISTIKIFSQLQSKKFHFDNEVERLLKIVKKAGISVCKVDFPLPITKDHYQKVAMLFNQIKSKNYVVAIAPGAKRSINRWPIERYIEIVQYLTTNGYTVVLLGDSGDNENCERIRKQSNGDVINFAGVTDLLESCVVIKKSILLICNDSGVQHLAAAVGTMSISLFSARDMYGKWHTFGDNNVIIRKWPECHTCFLEDCPYDNKCIKMIETREVISRINEKTDTI